MPFGAPEGRRNAAVQQAARSVIRNSERGGDRRGRKMVFDLLTDTGHVAAKTGHRNANQCADSCGQNNPVYGYGAGFFCAEP